MTIRFWAQRGELVATSLARPVGAWRSGTPALWAASASGLAGWSGSLGPL